MLRLIDNKSLIRGKMLIDYAFQGNDGLGMTATDLIGLVASYLDLRGHAVEMEEELTGTLGADIAHQACEVYDIFEGPEGSGLWQEDTATNDVTFSHPTLIARFPRLNKQRGRFVRPPKVTLPSPSKQGGGTYRELLRPSRQDRSLKPASR